MQRNIVATETPPTPRTMWFLGGKGGYFEKLSDGSKTSDMTSEGLGVVFEGDSADMCAGKFPLMSMRGRANGQACIDGERGHPMVWAEISSKLLVSSIRNRLDFREWLFFHNIFKIEASFVVLKLVIRHYSNFMSLITVC